MVAGDGTAGGERFGIEAEGDSYFVALWNEIWDMGLTAHEFAAYCWMCRRYGNGSKGVYESIGNMAARSGMVSPRQFHRAIKVLLDKNMLRVKKREIGRPTTYVIRDKRFWKYPTTSATQAEGVCHTGRGTSATQADEVDTSKKIPKDLSATKVAGEENASLFTEKEAVATSSAQGSSSAQSSPSSEVVSRARTRTNKKLSLSDSRFLELLPALAQAWNDNCGPVSKLGGNTVANSYRPNLVRIVNELISEGADPVQGIAWMAKFVSTLDSYRDGTYGFSNATRPSNWRSHYDSGKRRFGKATPAAAFKVGDKVSWLRRPGSEGLGRIYGVITSFNDGGYPVTEVTSAPDGYVASSGMAVNPGLLSMRLEDD